MITVRFPSGFSIQYNSATHIIYTGVVARLQENKDGAWIADVPLSSGAVIENRSPCHTYDANTRDITESAIIARLRQLSGYEVSRIKAELKKFDANRKAWKP